MANSGPDEQPLEGRSTAGSARFFLDGPIREPSPALEPSGRLPEHLDEPPELIRPAHIVFLRHVFSRFLPVSKFLADTNTIDATSNVVKAKKLREISKSLLQRLDESSILSFVRSGKQTEPLETNQTKGD